MLSWSSDGYGNAEEGLAALSEVAATGAQWVVFVPTEFMPVATSTQIVSGERSPSDESLIAAVRRAKALGMKVAIKPHVNSLDGTFRGYIRPSNETDWFRSYRVFILRYARLAQALQADAFVVGTELYSMTRARHEAPWRHLIRRVRQEYQGPLTYAAFWLEWDSVPFWSELDAIGVNAYFPMGLPGSGDSAARFVRVWREHYIPRLRGYARRHGKPIIFSEFGISSQSGVYVFPWVYRRHGGVDMRVQQNYFAAFFNAFRDQGDWFLGFWQWGWTVHNDDGGPEDISHTVQGKPALEVFRREFLRGAGR